MWSTLPLLVTSLLTVSSVDAFANTYPIVAWSNSPLQALSSLTPSPSTSASSRSSSHQKTFSSSSSSFSSDLCSLSTVILVTAPGLHYSDLSLLPPSPAGINARLEHHKESSLIHAYLPKQNGYRTSVEKLANEYVQKCGAVIETDGLKNFWSGTEGKSLRVVEVEGLDEWELVGKAAKDGRKEVVHRIDNVVQEQLQSVGGPYLLVVTSLPPASTQALLSIKQNPALQKRQQSETLQELETEVLNEIDQIKELLDEPATDTSGTTKITVSEPLTTEDVLEKEIAELNNAMDSMDSPVTTTFTEMYDDLATPWSSAQAAFKPNQTSIFEVNPKSGLLHRYVFFTPALILSIIISSLVLLPILVYTSQALTSVHTVHGLEHKMTGSVGVDAAK